MTCIHLYEAEVKLMIKLSQKDCTDTVRTVFVPDPQLQWRTLGKEWAKTIENQSRARGMEISEDQLLGEGDYANLKWQQLYEWPDPSFMPYSSFECLEKN